MKLLTREIERRFKKEGCQMKADDPVVVCKFFDPCSSWTWYAVCYHEDRRTFYGYVVGLEKEWGEFSLDELQAVRNPWGLGVERDMGFRPGRFSEVVPEAHR